MFLISYCIALLNADVILALKEKYKTILFNIFILFGLKYTGNMLWEYAPKCVCLIFPGLHVVNHANTQSPAFCHVWDYQNVQEYQQFFRSQRHYLWACFA